MTKHYFNSLIARDILKDEAHHFKIFTTKSKSPFYLVKNFQAFIDVLTVLNVDRYLLILKLLKTITQINTPPSIYFNGETFIFKTNETKARYFIFNNEDDVWFIDVAFQNKNQQLPTKIDLTRSYAKTSIIVKKYTYLFKTQTPSRIYPKNVVYHDGYWNDIFLHRHYDFNSTFNPILFGTIKSYLTSNLIKDVSTFQTKDLYQHEEIIDAHNNHPLANFLFLIGFDKLKIMIANNEKITSKNDFKKYLNWNTPFNLNKLSFSQIAVLWKLEQFYDFENISLKHRKKINGLFNILKQPPFLPKLIVDLNYVRFFKIIAECIAKHYLRSDEYCLIVNDVIESHIDLNCYEINHDFFFYLINLIAKDWDETKLHKLHQKLITRSINKNAQAALYENHSLCYHPELLQDCKNIVFVPIKNTYDLFRFSKIMHNCVYSRRFLKNTAFYQVVYNQKFYCLQISLDNVSNTWKIDEIKASCNRPVEDDLLINIINHQLKNPPKNNESQSPKPKQFYIVEY